MMVKIKPLKIKNKKEVKLFNKIIKKAKKEIIESLAVKKEILNGDINENKNKNQKEC